MQCAQANNGMVKLQLCICTKMYIYKHHIKLLQLLNPSFVEGAIARVYGSLLGIFVGGLHNLLIPIVETQRHFNPIVEY